MSEFTRPLPGWPALVLGTSLALVSPANTAAATLTPATTSAWNRYVQVTEERMSRQAADDTRFLNIDFDPVVTREADRRALRGGDVLVTQLSSRDSQGQRLRIEGGLVHHWRGAVFVAGTTIDQLLAPDPGRAPHRQEDLAASRVLSRDDTGETVFLRLTRKAIVTVSYNTEHRVEYRRLGPGRASRTSRSLRIAELEDADTPREREKPVGQDRGFLWRLNSYWRYEAVDGGVIVECESLSLSRGIPALLRWFVEPLVSRTARESMTRTLDALRQRFASPARTADGR